MQGRRKGKTIFSLMVCNLVVWLSAAGYQSVGIAAQAPANAQSNEQAQIEMGRQAVAQACAACHNNILRMIQSQTQSEEEWRDTVYSMIGRGGQILPEEIEPLTAFLTSVSSGRTSLPSQADGGRGQPVPGGVEVEGQAILQRSCQECHDLATATTRSTSEDWEAVIARMMTYGAALTPTDQQELIEYLNGLAQ